MSRIGLISERLETHSSKQSYKNVLDMLSKDLILDDRRVIIQKKLTDQELKRYKAFAFLDKARVFSNNYMKTGIETKFIKDLHNPHKKEVKVTCFWEALYGQVQNVIMNIKHSQINYPVRKTQNTVTFLMHNFQEFLDYPKLDLSFQANGNNFRSVVQLLIPINKFFKIPRQTVKDHERFYQNGYSTILTDIYPLDINFFKSKKEIKYVFRNFKDISKTEIGGIFEVQYIMDNLFLKINLLENYHFTAEIKYAHSHIENFIKSILQEIVLILGDFSENQN